MHETGKLLILFGLSALICCGRLENETTVRSSLVPSTATNMEVNDVEEFMTAAPTIRTFKDEEKAILNFVNSVMRQILPHVVKGTSTNLSPKCTGAMMKIFGSLRQLKAWSIKMLDSMGKPTSGILSGTPYSMANYDQCLKISLTKRGKEALKHEDELFHGQYCRVRIEMAEAALERALAYKRGHLNSSELGKLKEMIDAAPFLPFMKNPMSHFLGLCLPSLCHEEDISKLLGSLPFPGSATLESCESGNEMEVDFEKRIILGIFFLIGLIIIIGTAVDKLIHFLAEENLNTYLKRRCISIAISFSICSNTSKLIQRIENDEKEFPNWRVMRGLVVGTIFCLIVYHTYLPPFEAFYLQSSGLSNLETYLNRKYFAITVCMPVVIETLFLNYGFSLTNKVWKSTWKNGKKKINVIRIIISSYVRLCLPLLLCNGIIVMLTLIGSGPFWNDVFGPFKDKCETYWWQHLAMYGNFFDVQKQCLPHFWFVPCLMQIIFVSTLMTYIISRYRKFGIFLTICIVLGCSIAVGIVTFNNDYPPTNVIYFISRSSDEFWKFNYALPLNHAGSFAVGMLLGIFVAKRTRVKINPIVCVLGWILSLGWIIGMCMLLMFSFSGKDSVLSPAWSATYAATHRTLFAVAVGWIFVACAYDYGGFLGRVLSWSVFDPLYKMSYFAYLIHLIVIAFHIGISREHFYYSHTEMVMRSLGYICITYAVSYICCLIVDLPLKSLRSALYPSNFRQVNITSLNNGRNIVNHRPFGKQNDTGDLPVWNLESSKNGFK